MLYPIYYYLNRVFYDTNSSEYLKTQEQKDSLSLLSWAQGSLEGKVLNTQLRLCQHMTQSECPAEPARAPSHDCFASKNMGSGRIRNE